MDALGYEMSTHIPKLTTFGGNAHHQQFTTELKGRKERLTVFTHLDTNGVAVINRVSLNMFLTPKEVARIYALAKNIQKHQKGI